MRSGIYRITNLVTGMFYIGSAFDHIKRWDNHKLDLRLNRHCNPYLQSAWNKYGESNFEFKIIESVSKDLLIKREQFWIDQTNCYERTIGYNLCAIAGNVAGRKATPKTLAKLSAIHKGKPRSEETKAKIKATMQGRKFSLETREKMRQAQLGKKKSEEFKEMKRQAMLGNTINNGRSQSDKHKAAISASKIGHEVSEETKAKISNSNRNRIVSEDTRLKMSLSAKKRWQRQ